jgi:hypothetical protein
MPTSGRSEPGRFDRTLTGSRVALTIWLAVAFALCLVHASAALATPTSFTWTGGASSPSEEWSVSANWEGAVAPTGGEAIKALTFPRLTTPACMNEEVTDSCYLSWNDLSGLSAESMQVDDGDAYFIGGEKLALGSGGLSATPATGSSGPAVDFIELPVRLNASQKWSIANRLGGGIEENGIFVEGPLTGAGSSLTAELSNGAALILANETEVGPVTVEGTNAAIEHIRNGLILLAGGNLDAFNHNAVDLSNVFFAGIGAVGALATTAATVDVGTGTVPAGGLKATSVTLDPASGLIFEIRGSGAVAQSDYSQLLSEGPVELAGALVVVAGKSSASGVCPTIAPGTTYTLLSTTGTLAGVFDNAPEGGPEIPISVGIGCTATQTMHITYNRGGATKTVTGTVEAASAEQRHEEEERAYRMHEEEAAANRTHEEENAKKTTQAEEATKLAEQHATKVGEEAIAAAAKRREEEAVSTTKQNQEEAALIAAANKHLEEVAKAGVLADKESSPDAVLASTSLQESASGTVGVKISCPHTQRSCTGTVTLRTLTAVSAKAKASVLTLATGSFSVAGGQTKTATLHLSTQARKLLAHSHVLRVRATVLAHNPTGGVHTGQTIAKLHVHKSQRG